jgi:hypothetical protein
LLTTSPEAAPTGVLSSSDHVELIEGNIFGRAPVTSRHASVTARLLKWRNDERLRKLTLRLARAAAGDEMMKEANGHK